MLSGDLAHRRLLRCRFLTTRCGLPAAAAWQAVAAPSAPPDPPPSGPGLWLQTDPVGSRSDVSTMLPPEGLDSEGIIALNRILRARKALSGSAGHSTTGDAAASASVIHAG